MSHFPVLVFALVWTLVRCSCPAMCNCKNYASDATQNDVYTVATCDNIPANTTAEFSDKLRELTLNNLNESVEDLQSTISSLFPNVLRLSLRNSTLNLSNLTFSLNITHLDLSGNNLDTWSPPEDTNNQVRILDLSNNRITTLRNYTFRSLDGLQVLNISFNNISVLESDTFSELRNLKCLDLSGNAIVILTQKVFIPILSLQHLNLSKNHLNVLSEQSFEGLSKLQQLDLSWNNLGTLAPGSLELPNLARLMLEGNANLGKSRDASLLVATGIKLLTVDASRIGLKQVPPTITPSIKTLKLEGNEIKSINCGDLDSYPLLQMLDFTSNVIDFIEEDALGRLDSLTILILSNNKIREIPKSLPEKLETLKMERNELEQVTEGDLQGLTKLEVLVLNDNKIRIIGARAFSQLTSLVTLDLSRNPINVLQPGCLQGPVYLQVLRLSGIDLISPAKDVSFPLSAPEHLITLDLSRSPGLARQFLSDTAVLAAAKQLQELDLSNTDSDAIRSDLLHYLPQLRYLPLDGNKLNCSHLRWLGSWMRKQDDRRHNSVVCASPPDLWATPLIDLPEEESYSATRETATKLTTESILKTKGENTRKGDASTALIPVRATTEGIGNSTSAVGVNLDVPSDKLLTEILHAPPSVTTETKGINSEHNKKTNGILHQRGSNMTGIISKTTYRAVTETPALKKKSINSPGIKSRSSYTRVNDVSSYHDNYRREKSTTLFVDVMPNTDKEWNGKADGLSSQQNRNDINYHPGMIIMFIGVLILCALVAMFASKFNRKRNLARDRDIEVTSIPSITELW